MSQNLISQPKGEPITIHNNELNIPDFSVILFIEWVAIVYYTLTAMQWFFISSGLKAYAGAKIIDLL